MQQTRFESVQGEGTLEGVLNLYEEQGYTLQTVMALWNPAGSFDYVPNFVRRQPGEAETRWKVILCADVTALEFDVNALCVEWDLYMVVHLHSAVAGFTALLRRPASEVEKDS